MLRKWVFAMVLAGALTAIATAQSPPKFLTNDDIVSMVKGGQDVDTVLSAIRTQGTRSALPRSSPRTRRRSSTSGS